MYTIPYQVSATHYRVVLVLTDESLDRMRVHDPAAFLTENFPAPYKHLRLEGVAVAYADADAHAEFLRRVQASEEVGTLINWLHRGFTVKPEDYDGPMLSIRVKPTERRQ